MSPVTRLRMAALELGWLKVTLLGWPTEKLFQLTMAFWEDWVIVRMFPFGAPMVAAPDTTEPPRGKTLCARVGETLARQATEVSTFARL